MTWQCHRGVQAAVCVLLLDVQCLKSTPELVSMVQ